MAPRITDIGVYFGSCGQASSDMADNEFGYDFDVVDSDDSYESLGREPGCLVSQLLSLASSVKYTPTIYSIPVVLQPSLMNNLTNIDFSIDQYETQFYRLAQRNSRTLERLSVNVWCSTAISGLIVDADGGFVEYPCLRALQLYLWNSDESAELSAFRRAVPFPSLRFLRLSKCMRFSDDVLFRGNAATLEDLRIDLSPELVEMLKRFNVFTPYSHPKLRHVDIHHPEDLESTLFPTVVDYMQFVLGIAPGASHRAIGYFSPGPELQPALSLLCNHACIRILDIRHTCPTFGNVIDLIIALPLLSDLFTSEPVRGPLLPGATISDLPGSTLSTYNPISKRFRCWRIEHSGRIRIQDSAVCVLLLALLCPNFGHLSVSLASRDGYLSAMKEIIAMDGYRQHEQRLRRLLPDNCK
ncbi:hypothetical protein IWW47_001262 [Coemansia sp. RSA 2052]|nr:hypothetical protein IWW47_001262 [Coemansia sp. RSA 2052]